jgi:sugar phosphate isomerase/epimerase
VATFVEAVRPAADYAGRHGVAIVLENEAHDDSGTAAGVRAIVEAVGSPYFGTLFDACNYYQAGEEAFPYAYEVLKQHVRYAHVKGGCRYRPDLLPHAHRGGTLRGIPDAHIGYVPIADGAVNVDGLLQRLARDGYDGFVTLEPHVPPAEAEAYYRAEVPYVRTRLREAQRRATSDE